MKLRPCERLRKSFVETWSMQCPEKALGFFRCVERAQARRQLFPFLFTLVLDAFNY